MAQLTSQAFITRTLTPNTAIAAVAAGSSAVDGLTGQTVDMSNWNGVVFIQGLTGGGAGGAISFSVRASSVARNVSGTTAADTAAIMLGSTSTVAAGSSATGEVFVADIYKPRQYASVSSAPFLYGVVTCGSCSVLGQQYAIQYEPRAAANTTAATTSTTPQSTQTSTGSGVAGQSGITGGVVRIVSPTT